jgi:hypothetical protein
VRTCPLSIGFLRVEIPNEELHHGGTENTEKLFRTLLLTTLAKIT